MEVAAGVQCIIWILRFDPLMFGKKLLGEKNYCLYMCDRNFHSYMSVEIVHAFSSCVHCLSHVHFRFFLGDRAGWEGLGQICGGIGFQCLMLEFMNCTCTDLRLKERELNKMLLQT